MIPKLLYTSESSIAKPLRMPPTVLIKMRFEPLAMSKTFIEAKIRDIFNKVGGRVYTLFPTATAEEILEKLFSVTASLNYTSQKKSVVIYLSGNTERVYYLNSIVKEDVSVGRPFTAKDIFRNEEFARKYLVLVLTKEFTKIFEGQSDNLSLHVLNLPEQVAAYSGYSSNEFKTQKDFLQQFLNHAIGILKILLSSNAIPYFVVATAEAKDVFLSLSECPKNAIAYINLESDLPSDAEISHAIKPFISDWTEVRNKDIMNQIRLAEQNGKLVAGIEEVWKTARHCRCKLLAVEKNYQAPAYFDNHSTIPFNRDMIVTNSLHMKDAVDDAIEQVLKDGGEVHLVEQGLLDHYLHITLIKY
jgi:hypothetical protein